MSSIFDVVVVFINNNETGLERQEGQNPGTQGMDEC